jgi:hypothetical protein
MAIEVPGEPAVPFHMANGDRAAEVGRRITTVVAEEGFRRKHPFLCIEVWQTVEKEDKVLGSTLVRPLANSVLSAVT